MKLSEDSLNELLERAGRGDRKAIEALFGAYRSTVRKFVHARFPRALAPRCDESDIVQDTLMLAARRLRDYLRRKPMPFGTWLLKTALEQIVAAQRRHLGAARRSVNREIRLRETSSQMIVRNFAIHDPQSGSRTAQQETRSNVQAAIEELDPLNQQILLMRLVEKLSYEDIAFILNIKPPTARQRYSRALEKLSHALRDKARRSSDDAPKRR